MSQEIQTVYAELQQLMAEFKPVDEEYQRVRRKWLELRLRCSELARRQAQIMAGLDDGEADTAPAIIGGPGAPPVRAVARPRGLLQAQVLKFIAASTSPPGAAILRRKLGKAAYKSVTALRSDGMLERANGQRGFVITPLGQERLDSPKVQKLLETWAKAAQA